VIPEGGEFDGALPSGFGTPPQNSGRPVTPRWSTRCAIPGGPYRKNFGERVCGEPCRVARRVDATPKAVTARGGCVTINKENVARASVSCAHEIAACGSGSGERKPQRARAMLRERDAQ
jgi:hypothetical protein